MPFTANGDDAAGCEARFVDNPDLGLIAAGDVELARAANDGEVVGRGSEGRGAHVPRPRIDGHELVLTLAADEQRRTVVGDVETVQLPPTVKDRAMSPCSRSSAETVPTSTLAT